MANDVNVHKRIEKISDIETALFLTCSDQFDPVIESVINILDADYEVFHSSDGLSEYLRNSSPHILFIHCDEHFQNWSRSQPCQTFRDSGYEGVIVLITDDVKKAGGSSLITSKGFDSYIISSDNMERIEDSIHLAIVNRKRKGKYAVYFDDALDSFYTIDNFGRVFDINLMATQESEYTPREIVKNEINIDDVGTLAAFRETIQPLIARENIGKVFSHTIDEGNSVFQVRCKIQNVFTIGLVATVVKTDVTKTIYDNTIDILVNSITLLSQRDNYTAGHSSRVLYYSMYFADRLGYSRNKKFARGLYFASLLHDIGKIGVKDNILLKAGRLTHDEYNEISSHPVKGYKMLSHYEFLKDSRDLILYHHERPDGRGYPDKLKGNRIPFGSSIISVADSFDAMTTTRPYRKSLSYKKAVSEIRENLGGQYDADIGKAFLSMITPELVRNIREASRKPLDNVAHELVESILN